MSHLVRPATPDDAAACAAIYEHYVRDTAITFETTAPDPAAMADRIAAALDRHAWVVLEEDAQVVGYAYGTQHRTRPAYRWCTDVSVYVEPGRRRTGAGRALYGALLPALRERGYRRALAGVALPNDASLGLHRAHGFEDVGVYRRVGWKLGRWHDVAWLQLDLVPDEDPLAPPDEVR